MITRGFVDRLYATATVQRWTDHVRPMDMTALGKHAHMVVIAWVIGRRAERTENWQIDWDYLVKASLWELFRVSVLTDIKSPVLDEIRSNPTDRKNLDAYVVRELGKALEGCPAELSDGMADYYADNHRKPERWNAFKVLRAASALATSWEFSLIEQANPHLHDISETRENIEAGVRRHQYIPAVLDVYEHRNDLARFTDMCGRLRFQLRWAQTPILPPRPVLDHELLVAYLAYACAVDAPVSAPLEEYWRRYHAFFGALFHDLPEVLTRDIVSPVKHGAQIDKILARIEGRLMVTKIAPLLPERLYRELEFFAVDEFDDKPWPPESWPSYLDLPEDGRQGIVHPGSIIIVCDKFAAFMEAYYSLSFGITSSNLFGAVFPSKAGLASRAKLNESYDFGPLYTLYASELGKMQHPQAES